MRHGQKPEWELNLAGNQVWRYHDGLLADSPISKALNAIQDALEKRFHHCIVTGRVYARDIRTLALEKIAESRRRARRRKKK